MTGNAGNEPTALLPPTPLSRNRDFTLLWSGGVLSDIGSFSSRLAVPLLVLAITGSPTQAGAVGTMSLAVTALGRLPGGAVADRWNRRRVMLTSNAISVLLAATLAVSVLLGAATFGLVVAVVALLAVCEVMFSPAEMAAISRLVPTDQLSAAFARNEARSYAASLGGPALGGLLFGVGRAVPFFADTVSYMTSFVAISAIRTPVQSERGTPSTQSVLTDIRQGLSYVAHSAFLRAVLTIAAPLNLGLTGAVFTVTLALRQNGTPAGTIGIAQGVIGVGGLLGALAASRILHQLRFRTLIITICLALVLAVATAAALTGRVVMTVPLAVGVFLAPSVNAALFGRLATDTPDPVQARVISVVFLAATSAAALAPLGSGLLVTHLGATAAMLGATSATAVAATIALTAPGLHQPGPHGPR